MVRLGLVWGGERDECAAGGARVGGGRRLEIIVSNAPGAAGEDGAGFRMWKRLTLGLPRYAKPWPGWVWIGTTFGSQVTVAVAMPLLSPTGRWSVLWIFLAWVFMPLLAVVPILRHKRVVRRRLRETECQLCPDCGYDLREHEDGTPCPECGRNWNHEEDIAMWRMTRAWYIGS